MNADFCFACPSSSFGGAGSDTLSLNQAIDQVGVAIQHAKSSLEISTQTLGAIFKEVLPSAEAPSTITGYDAPLGPESKTLKAFLDHGVAADYEPSYLSSLRSQMGSLRI